MKKINIVFAAFTLCCFLATLPTDTFAQEQNTTTAQTDDDDDDDKDYGWIGLIGLAGLLGLRKREHVVDRDVRPANRV